MNKLITTVMALSLAFSPCLAQNIVIYGRMTSSDDVLDEPCGIYSFSPKAGLTLTKLVDGNWNMFYHGGCVAIDGKFYDFNSDNNTITTYDMETWQTVGQPLQATKNAMATDLTLDITTNTVYGCFYDEAGGYVFGTVDVSKGTRTKIADLNQQFLGMAADQNGTVYGIGLDSKLYKFNKQNGSTTLIGETGVAALSQFKPQSAEFDTNSNTLYWCHNTTDYKSYFYKVDTATGKAQLVSQFPHNQMFYDICIPAVEQTSEYDAPAAVGNLNLSISDRKSVSLSWTAPTEGENGGKIDAGNLRYKVVRQPGNFVCEESSSTTTFSEVLSLESMQKVSYEVTPFTGDLIGETAESNQAIAGPAVEIPYFNNFEQDNDLSLFTITDGFNDRTTWKRITSSEGNSYAGCMPSGSNAKDEWLITPAYKLEKGKQYVLSFRASSIFSTRREKMEVAIGKGTSAADMTQVIMPVKEIDNAMSYQWNDYSFPFTVDEDGEYSVGFHAVSEANKHILGVDNIRIEGSSMEAPEKVPSISAVAAEKGELSATVTISLPEKTVSGKPISSFTKVEITCNGKIAAEIENPAKGSEISRKISTESGMNTIQAIAYNEAGGSIPNTTEVYTGLDAPGSCNVTAKVVDGKQVITWDMPTGKNGGYVDPESVTYAVFRAIGDEQDPIAADLTELKYEDDYAADDQTIVTYVVMGANKLGYGNVSVSNSVVIGGEAYKLPFKETFAAGFQTSVWGVVSKSGLGAWALSSGNEQGLAQPQDEDKGMIYFKAKAIGDRCQIFSGNISMEDSHNPTLEFYYYQRQSGNKLTVLANAETNGWDVLKTIDFSTSQTNGWQRVSIPLSAYENSKYIQIAFEADSKDMQPIEIDNITIRNVYSNDLAVAISSRKRVELGAANKISATVTNYGAEDASDYDVKFYRNNELISTQEGKKLQPNESAVFAIDETATLGSPESADYYAEVDYAADENTGNNRSLTASVTNVLPKFPAAKNLSGSAQGNNVSLSWEAPEKYVAPAMQPVTESFESYEPFAIDELGEWELVDVDGQAGTFGLLPLNYPYREAAKSFQVFNAFEIGIDTPDETSEWAAKSGKQMLISFADLDRQSDDWLISPVLTGDAQEISFYVRSITSTYGLETYEVLASKGGKQLSEFVKVADGEAPEEAWTEVKVQLPEGTNYFAIRCTSADKFCMVLDDITYTPGTGLPKEFALTGYNIYRDGKVVANVAKDKTKCSVDAGDSDKHSYTVTAVYDKGESRFSNEVELQAQSGVSDANNETARVYASGQAIVVENAQEMPIAVYNTNGTTVFAGVADTQSLRIPASNGLYIVKVGTKAAKVAVR